MLREKYTATKSWLTRHPRRSAVCFLSAAIGGVILLQFLYPTTNLVPFTSVDTMNFGVHSKAEATKELDTKLKESEVAIYFEGSDSAFFVAQPNDLGITAANEDRVDSIDYAWYWRLIPGSVLWMHFITNPSVASLQYQRSESKLTEFINIHFGDSCQLDPKDANLEVNDGTIRTIEARSGVTCDPAFVKNSLQTVQPTIGGAKVTISGEELPATISTADAEEFSHHVASVIKNGIGVNDGKTVHLVDMATLLSWLDFTNADGKLDYILSAQRSSEYLNEKIGAAVAKPAGVTTVTTYDFQETARSNGSNGVALDVPKLLDTMKTSLEAGEKEIAAATKPTPPSVKYNSTYSPTDTGLSALMKNYAETHPGTYALSLRELSGARRNASYRADTQYVTASTFKLFVAYSTLLRIESGAWKWSDQINGGRDVSKCFDDMIVKSDNACAEAMLRKVGFKEITNEAKAIGCVNTTFLGNSGIKSTANDEALLLSKLQTGQILNQQANRDIFMGALKRNIFRQGIPKGIPSATVANKVGFLDGLLHDASIVFTAGGDTYVLVILTEGASWANIAELASQIETLRTK